MCTMLRVGISLCGSLRNGCRMSVSSRCSIGVWLCGGPRGSCSGCKSLLNNLDHGKVLHLADGPTLFDNDQVPSATLLIVIMSKEGLAFADILQR